MIIKRKKLQMEEMDKLFELTENVHAACNARPDNHDGLTQTECEAMNAEAHYISQLMQKYGFEKKDYFYIRFEDHGKLPWITLRGVRGETI